MGRTKRELEMDKSEVLDEFEKTIMNTVNSKYLEVVNEMNDGFNNLLQTALANADMFSISIKLAIQQLKDEMSPTFTSKGMMIKDENQEMVENRSFGNDGYSIKEYEDPRSFDQNNYENNFDRNINASNSYMAQKNDIIRDVNFSFPPKQSNVPHKQNNNIFKRPTINQVSASSYNQSQYKSSNGKGRPSQDNKEEEDDSIITETQVLDNGLVVKKHRCKECGHTASYKYNLVLHIKRKHKFKGYNWNAQATKTEKGFMCEQCDYTAMKHDSLISHLTTKHSDTM